MQLFLAFLVALSVTAVLIPPLARWAPSLGLTDRPGPRKVHSLPVPRVGGLAMAVGMLVPLSLANDLHPSVSGLLAGMVVLLVFGVWDDRAELGYRLKLLGQVLAALIVMISGDVRIDSLTIGMREPLPDLVSLPVTLLFLVGITNAVNLSDGLDGLAGGMVLLCLSAVALFAASSGNLPVMLIALSAAGSILGFLRFNTHPARVFMGDAGSQLLGFTLGVLAILATQGTQSVISASLPLLLLGMPVLDTLQVMTRRIRAGRSPFSSDRLHLHHRLLGLGLPHRGAVAVIYAAQCVLVLLAWFMRFESDLLIIATFLMFATLLILLLSRAERVGWRWAAVRAAGEALVMPPAHSWFRTLVSRASVVVMCASLVVYATAAIATSPPIGADLGLLCAGLLGLLGVLMLSPTLSVGAERIERPLAYLAVVLLVYLEQTTPARGLALVALSWTLLGAALVAAVARFCVAPERRFEVTSLDLLVIFIALVVPNLPGTIPIPEGLTTGVAKAVMLLYVVEMLLFADAGRRAPRLFLAAALSAIALRSAFSVMV